jgi:hypothetical protein
MSEIDTMLRTLTVQENGQASHQELGFFKHALTYFSVYCPLHAPKNQSKRLSVIILLYV